MTTHAPTDLVSLDWAKLYELEGARDDEDATDAAIDIVYRSVATHDREPDFARIDATIAAVDLTRVHNICTALAFLTGPCGLSPWLPSYKPYFARVESWLRERGETEERVRALLHGLDEAPTGRIVYADANARQP